MLQGFDVTPMPAGLPPGLDPVSAGRLGLWLLGARQHRKAVRRKAFPKTGVYTGQNLTRRFTDLILPWKLYEYPGPSLWLAELCGVSRGNVRRWLRNAKPPRKHCERLARYLRDHASQCEALARELEASAPPATRRGRPAKPHKIARLMDFDPDAP